LRPAFFPTFIEYSYLDSFIVSGVFPEIKTP
jgi:hypothetical protein